MKYLLYCMLNDVYSYIHHEMHIANSLVSAIIASYLIASDSQYMHGYS